MQEYLYLQCKATANATEKYQSITYIQIQPQIRLVLQIILKELYGFQRLVL